MEAGLLSSALLVHVPMVFSATSMAMPGGADPRK